MTKTFGLFTRLFKQIVIEQKLEYLAREWTPLMKSLKKSLETGAKALDLYLAYTFKNAL